MWVSRVREHKDTLGNRVVLLRRHRALGAAEAEHVQAALPRAEHGATRKDVLGEEDVRVVEEAPLADALVQRHTPLALARLPVPDRELVRRAPLHHRAEVRVVYARRVAVHARLQLSLGQFDGARCGCARRGERVRLAVRERAEEDTRLEPDRGRSE